MKILELFCGTKSISKAFTRAGHKVITLDNDKRHNPDICKSILDFDIKDLPHEWKPHIIWASPPCQTFSVASISQYWDQYGKPKTWKTHIGLAYVMKTIEIIQELKPKYYFIENPRGMLRQQAFIQKLYRKTVTYCQYGAKVQKPTDIWTNAYNWVTKKMCCPGDNCHESAKRGADTGTQNQNRNPIERAIIPEKLCEEIVNLCEGKTKQNQTRLINETRTN